MNKMPPILRETFYLHSTLPIHRRRVAWARDRVAGWLALVQRPYIAFSTGKDSTCLLHLIREQRPETPAVYFDADASYPESLAMLAQTPVLTRYLADEPLITTLQRLGMEHPRLEETTMETTVWGPIRRLVGEYGFDGVGLGLRAQESYGRTMNARTKGSRYQYKRDGLWACQPLHDWDYMDVWGFIVNNGLDYCGVYDRMWDMPQEDQRLSYYAGETKRQHGRYVWLRRNYPELYDSLASQLPEVRCFV
jgi:phosphoadenosine phosphosulfate reductase